MLVAVLVFERIVISNGSRRWVFAMRRMFGDSVAENSATWRSAGICAQDRVDRVDEAHRSISSASSSTTKRNVSRLSVPRSRWSMIRPGVPTMTCVPRLSAFNCGV
jgi:hypothetical protein